MDVFNLNKINNKALALNKGIVNITEICEQYVINPSEDCGTMMIGTVVKLDQDLKALKQAVAELISKIDNEEVNVSKQGDGYIIKEQLDE
jgi:hypothetical protein